MSERSWLYGLVKRFEEGLLGAINVLHWRRPFWKTHSLYEKRRRLVYDTP